MQKAEFLKFRTEGFKELEEVLLEVAKDMGYDKTTSRVLIPAVRSAMEPVLRDAYARSPYNEENIGAHMRDSLRISARRPSAKDTRSQYYDKGDVVIGEVSVRTDKRGKAQEYGFNHYMVKELGNARVPAQPFLRPALRSQANNVINRLGTFLTYKLQQYKSKKA